MITIIHGNDIVSSRQFFVDQKNKATNPVVFQGVSLTVTDLAQVLSSGGLFGNENTLFIEELLSQRKKAAQADSIISYIFDNQDKGNIVLWEEKEISGATLKRFKSAAVKTFRIPPLIFAFLDSLAPGCGPQCINMLDKTLKTSDIELVFYLLVRQFRLLLALTNEGNSPIEEVKRLQVWQTGKLKRQSIRFSEEALRKNYRRLYAIEVGQKTGTLSVPLRISIDFFLLEI